MDLRAHLAIEISALIAMAARIVDHTHTRRFPYGTLTPDNHALALEIAEVPMAIKGFGAVKMRAAEEAGRRRAALMERWRSA